MFKKCIALTLVALCANSFMLDASQMPHNTQVPTNMVVQRKRLGLMHTAWELTKIGVGSTLAIAGLGGLCATPAVVIFGAITDESRLLLFGATTGIIAIPVSLAVSAIGAAIARSGIEGIHNGLNQYELAEIQQVTHMPVQPQPMMYNHQQQAPAPYVQQPVILEQPTIN